jgi:hypothetical protein
MPAFDSGYNVFPYGSLPVCLAIAFPSSLLKLKADAQMFVRFFWLVFKAAACGGEIIDARRGAENCSHHRELPELLRRQTWGVR